MENGNNCVITQMFFVVQVQILSSDMFQTM